MLDRLVPFERIYNFRDFGGYDTADGPVARGRLFRSASFHDATEADIARLEAMEVRFLVDLRRPEERAFEPNRWPGENRRSIFNDEGAGGVSLGWNRFEGNTCFSDPCDPSAHVFPSVTYTHDEGCTIVGGPVYRGTLQPALAGLYLFGDYCSGRLWAADADAMLESVVTPMPIGRMDGTLVSFGVDADGEPLAVDHGGRILRIVADTSGVAALRERLETTTAVAREWYEMGVPLNQLIEQLDIPLSQVETPTEPAQKRTDAERLGASMASLRRRFDAMEKGLDEQAKAERKVIPIKGNRDAG